MRGTTTECLQHYLGPDATYLRNMTYLRRFTSATSKAVIGWRVGVAGPQREMLLKVRVFLDVLGYEIEEFSNLPEDVKSLAQLLAFGCIIPNSARRALCFAAQETVNRILLNGKKLTREQEQTLSNYIRGHEDQLETALQQLRDSTGEARIAGGDTTALQVAIDRVSELLASEPDRVRAARIVLKKIKPEDLDRLKTFCVILDSEAHWTR